MFKISKVKTPIAPHLFERLESGFEQTALDKFCVVDDWSGDLANGLFQLGKVTEQLHGLADGECGLLTLLRCYEPTDRINILEILENASSSASSFCFCTHIITGPGGRQPMFCLGESGGFVEGSAGQMSGVFIYPRMPVEIAGH